MERFVLYLRQDTKNERTSQAEIGEAGDFFLGTLIAFIAFAIFLSDGCPKEGSNTINRMDTVHA